MKIIVANWKMNHSFDEADSWIDSFLKDYLDNKERLENVELVLCPPTVLLDYVDSELMHDGFENFEALLKAEQRDFEDFSEEELTRIVLDERPIKLGGQDCSAENNGSFTGDISADMLNKVGCQYVILGHSERRSYHFETDEIVSKKVQMALSKSLTPIICVGESKEVRDSQNHLEFVCKQVLNSVPKNVAFNRLIIAYEPIWSIGTGVLPSLAQISEMNLAIKKLVEENFSGFAKEVFVLYGGSVNSANSGEILKADGVAGLLVGKASLDAKEFLNIALSQF